MSRSFKRANADPLQRDAFTLAASILRMDVTEHTHARVRTHVMYLRPQRIYVAWTIVQYQPPPSIQAEKLEQPGG